MSRLLVGLCELGRLLDRSSYSLPTGRIAGRKLSMVMVAEDGEL